MNSEEKRYHDILLYWSGELDAPTSAKVEKILEEDAEARSYYQELGELAEDFKGLPQSKLEQSLAERAVRGDVAGRKIISLPVRWGLAIAAVLAIGLFALQLFGPATDNGGGTAETVSPSPSPEATPKVKPLSSQLFTSKSRFSRKDRASSARERVRKFRASMKSIQS